MDFLEQVVAERRTDVASARAAVPDHALYEDGVARRGHPVIDGAGDVFTRALLRARGAGHLGVIAEVKRTSPALGPLRVAADVPEIARRYEAAGATAISVLTEPRHWGGSLDDLAAARAAVAIPILRKDVVVDEYQVIEAWVGGADAVLLIAEALEDALLHRLVDRAMRLGIGVLVEAHETEDFARATRSGAVVVGVNARDLRRPSRIHQHRIRAVHHLALPRQILVAESGIASLDDVRALPQRVDAVLVGTALMRAAEPELLIRQLATVPRAASVTA